MLIVAGIAVSLTQWKGEFLVPMVDWYNNQHLHSALKFVTQQQRHTGEDLLISATRTVVYEQAKAKHPEHWSAQTRDWSLPINFTLNPTNDHNNINDAANLAKLSQEIMELTAKARSWLAVLLLIIFKINSANNKILAG